MDARDRGRERGRWHPGGMSFALQVAVLAATLLSLIFHHFHSKRLNQIGDVIDEVRALAPSNVKPSQGGFASVGSMLAIALLLTIAVVSSVLALSPGCTWAKHEGTVVKTSAVDCTKGELATAVATYAPVLGKVFQLSTGSVGKVDWSQVGDATAHMVGDDAGCVFASAVTDLIRQAIPQPGAPKSSALAIDANDLALHFKAKFGGKTYHTASGDL